mgnify:CR=1 FL=1
MSYLVLASVFFISFHRHSYVAYASFLLIVSISPLVKYLLGVQTISLFYAIFLVGIIFASIIRDKGRINKIMIFFGLGIALLLLIQQLVVGFEFAFLALGLVKLLMLPLLGYFVAKELHAKNHDLFSVLFFYILINLAIFYFRAFFEYTFFGILDVSIEEWVYRPSNLTSPIIFAIEVVIIIALMYVSDVPKWRKICLLGLIFLPLILMQTRAAMLLLALMTVAYLIYSKQFRSIVILSITSVIIVFLFWILSGEMPYIFSIFSYDGGAYGKRASSIADTLDIYSEFGVLKMLIGAGSGLASQHASSFGHEAIYVENGLLALLVENGLLFFIMFIGALAYYPLRTRLVGISGYLYFLLFLIVVINIFSASLTTLSIQALFWLIYFYGLFIPNRERKLLSSKIRNENGKGHKLAYE